MLFQSYKLYSFFLSHIYQESKYAGGIPRDGDGDGVGPVPDDGEA
jgi:hypothetical protein